MTRNKMIEMLVDSDFHYIQSGEPGGLELLQSYLEFGRRLHYRGYRHYHRGTAQVFPIERKPKSGSRGGGADAGNTCRNCGKNCRRSWGRTCGRSHSSSRQRISPNFRAKACLFGLFHALKTNEEAASVNKQVSL